jgi:flagellar hook-basal body complex protein FliE
MQPISGMQTFAPAQPELLPLHSGEKAGQADFQSVLFKALEDVNRLDSQAQASVAEGLTGPQGLQTETYVQMMQADLAFRTMLQIRNKLLDAYNELKQMQV